MAAIAVEHPVPAPTGGGYASMTETRLERRIRLDLRRVRETAGYTQEGIAELFGWNRDAVSKLENGSRRIRMADFLQVVDFCREAIPGHPAVALIEHYAPAKSRRGKSPYAPPTAKEAADEDPDED